MPIISIRMRMDGSVQKDLGNRDAKTERKIGHIDPDKTEHKKGMLPCRESRSEAELSGMYARF